MVGTILAQWYQTHNHHWPEKIIYYRDGVSKDEYVNIRTKEIKYINDAISHCAQEMGKDIPTIKITAIVVTKRHHTRFYLPNLRDAKDKRNCTPGTLVDSAVTKPYYVDFFLQSHYGNIGTARPARYDVIQNDTGHTIEELQGLVSLS
jgi:eukaryotic translation initiation factor 2C